MSGQGAVFSFVGEGVVDAVLENDVGHTTVCDDDILDDGLDEGLDDLAINRPDELGSILTVALHELLHHDEVACLLDEGMATFKALSA